MFAEGVPLPIKLLVTVPALMFGAMIFLAENTPRSWLVITAAVLFGLFVLLSFLEYPLSASWPAFVGLFLLVMCVLAFVRQLPDVSPLPFTHTDLEIWGYAILASLYLIWGVVAGRRAAMYL